MIIGTAILATLLATVVYALSELQARPAAPAAHTPAYLDDHDLWMSLQARGE